MISKLRLYYPVNILCRLFSVSRGGYYSGLLRADIKERKTILPWLNHGGLVMVYAKRGEGKTWFSLSLAASLASGTPFMKWEVSEPVGCAYLDGEMSLHDCRERLIKFMRTAPEAPLQILNHEPYFEKTQRDIDITDKSTQDEILAMLDRNEDIKVIICDNLSSLTRIREDFGDDWRSAFLPFLLACRRRQVAVILVHHAGKSGQQRGTSTREDHLDTSILLRKAGDDNSAGANFIVEFTKSRGAYGATTEPFSAQLIEIDGHLEWSITNLAENAKNRLINLIRECDSEGLTSKEAVEELGVAKGTISKARKALLQEGLISIQGSGHNSRMMPR